MALEINSTTPAPETDRCRHGDISLSVVIPIGPGDRSWIPLVEELAAVGAEGVELILSAAEAEAETESLQRSGLRWRWLQGPSGRAGQLNRGAAAARGEYVWFLHADSRFRPAVPFPLLLQRLEAQPQALWYFDLHFLPDGPHFMMLNQLGARLRSRLLGLPFGDQGFALAKSLLLELGGYREDAAYGEDHLLIWAARRAGVPVRSTGCAIHTSSRRYLEQGWWATTLRHLWRTGRQAVPQSWRWLRGGGR